MCKILLEKWDKGLFFKFAESGKFDDFEAKRLGMDNAAKSKFQKFISKLNDLFAVIYNSN